MVAKNYYGNKFNGVNIHKGVKYFEVKNLPCKYFVLSDLITGDIEDNNYKNAAYKVGDQWYSGYYTTDLTAINKNDYGYVDLKRLKWKLKLDLFSY